MDLLDSIMSKMDKPPVINDRQRQLMKEQRKAMEEARTREKELLNKFRSSVEERLNRFMQESTQLKKSFEPMDRVYRSVVRDVAEVVGLITHVFGVEEEERYVMVFKKEYPLTDDELYAYRNGLEWDPVKAKEEALQKERQIKEDVERAKKLRKEPTSKKFMEKYERLVGTETKLEAAGILENDRQFGFVRSELKKDKRTIEETLADIKAKKMKKLEDEQTNSDPGNT